ncbi:hypothetical protein NG895_19285 [Aeoliella sp. ICT_H6.2]|uniref:Uncharacterized protein n=1 Tax=Aeoliella straminimaris TaxID=2954799 RepID=A0A9X2JK86_9BACT|nr:hypothetical protein [Aeoliella straminimaris]MCO6046049.1 hypothetical protein [Aeoliella straminimaris]
MFHECYLSAPAARDFGQFVWQFHRSVAVRCGRVGLNIVVSGVIVALCSLVLVTASGAAEPDRLAKALEDVEHSLAHRYQARDDRGKPLDCLNPCQASEGNLLGVYHFLDGGVFKLALAESDNGLQWRRIRQLDTHASQGHLHAMSDGRFLLAYEKDAPNSCWIRLEEFKDLESLRSGEPNRSIDLTRSLAPTAEGTPMIDRVDQAGSRQVIDLRLHYYRDAQVDRLARGQLVDFQQWTAKPDPALNRDFTNRGARGNFGSRDLFRWSGGELLLQEIQLRPQDWAAWRVYLCERDGEPIRQLDIRTHGHSKSFANPHAERVTLAGGQQAILVTLFLPSQGAAPGEAGELIYLVRDPGQ